MPSMHGSPSGKGSIIVPRYETGLRIEIEFCSNRPTQGPARSALRDPVPLMNQCTVLELSAFLALALTPHYIEFEKAVTIA